MKIAQPYRSPSEYVAYLKGATAAANAFGHDVDSDSWGGGIPNDLTLTPQKIMGGPPEEPVPDVYEQEAENAEIPDAATEPDSEGPPPNGESGSST
jgi:hypothetical protein